MEMGKQQRQDGGTCHPTINPSVLRGTASVGKMPRQSRSVRESAGNLLGGGEGASRCRICGTERKPSSAAERPRGKAAPRDGSTGNQASLALLLTELLCSTH